MANMNYEVQVIYFQRSRPKKITFLCKNIMLKLNVQFSQKYNI